MSLKTPTCLLLDNNKKFVSFGFEAENEYANLAMDGEQDKYYYFYRFKMKLHNNKVNIYLKKRHNQSMWYRNQEQPRAIFYLRPLLFFICLLKL
jgi:hypothetical protein